MSEKKGHASPSHIEAPDLAHNLTGKIQNPLHGIPREELLNNVDAFVTETGLEQYRDTFRRGALVAQAPGYFEELDEITEEEKALIRREKTHKWTSHPWPVFMTVIVCSIGAAAQGWDQTGSNAGNLSFPREFGIESIEGDPDAAKNQWILGIVNAAPYLASAFLGTWLADPINHWFGRRGTIFISGIFVCFPVLAQGFTQTWEQLFVTRLLLGIGMGMKGTAVPIFAAENSPAAIRGGLVMSWQLWTAFGIFIGLCANLILFGTGAIAWRLQMAAAFIPAVPLMGLIYFCPESPRWLMSKGRYPQAMKSFLRLRSSELQACRDMYYVHCQLELERKIVGASNIFVRFYELFKVPRLRRATLASFTVMIAQQMCGINIIAFYSSSIFVEAGFSEKRALLVSFGFGLVNFVFAFPAIWTIDTFGRRSLLLLTFPNMAWALFATGGCYLMPESNAARIPLVSLFIFIFAAFYSPGEGPVPFTYSAEVFPLSHREVGMAWAVSTCLFWAAVLSIMLPRMLGALGAHGVFFLYGGFNLVALVMIFFWVPETKQRTLEELDYVFATPTSKHISYQTTKAVPYFIQRHVLRNKNATLEPLFDFEEVDGRHQEVKGGSEFKA